MLLWGCEGRMVDFVTGIFTIAPSVRATHYDEIMFHRMSARDMSVIIKSTLEMALFLCLVLWSLGHWFVVVFTENWIKYLFTPRLWFSIYQRSLLFITFNDHVGILAVLQQ